MNATTEVARVHGTAQQGVMVRTGQELAERVDAIADTAIWCSPMNLAGGMPEGCSAFLAAARVRPADCHEIERGKFAPSAATLYRLAATAGVSWVPDQSRRTDDGSNPHYCAFQATARLRALTGELVTMDATYELDLRAPDLRSHDPSDPGEMSGRVATMIAAAQRKNLAKPSREQLSNAALYARVQGNLDTMRTHIVSRCETGARARAIRKVLGLANTFTADELRDKVFATVRLVLPIADVLASERPSTAAALLYAPRGARWGAPPPPVGASDEDFDAVTGEITDSQIDFADACDPDRPDGAPVDDRAAAVERVIALAARKGKLGTGHDQVTEGWVRARSDLDLVTTRLEAMPDAVGVPSWMR